MFKPPRKTLQKSLDTLLDNAPEYVADVYFDYPEGKLWAHKAILLARMPMSFQQRISLNDKTTTIDLKSLIPYNLCQTLLRYWYTANFYAERSESPVIGSMISSGSTLSAASTKTSVSSMITDEMDSMRSTTATTAVRAEIEQLEKQLGCELLSTITGDTKNEFEQLVCDLERMRIDQLASDVHVTLFTPTTSLASPPSSPSPTTRRNTCFSSTGKEIPSILFTHTDPSSSTPNDQPQQQRTSFPAHRFMLAAQSPYFYAMFCTQFRESSSSTVHLPGDLFSPAIAEATLRFFYTDSLKVPDLPNVLPPGRQRLAQKKYTLRILQQMFPAGDYLGHGDTLCEAALYEMDLLCHGFKCVCADCAALLPSMLWFADKQAATMPTLRSALLALYSEPVHALAPLWSQQPFAILVGALTLTDESLAEQALLTLFTTNNNSTSNTGSGLSTLVDELRKHTLQNVTKHNAIHVLHSLHLCLSKLRGSNPFPTWSSPVLDILNPIVHHTVEMVASNFDFYCVEYPILLSCVDGIGHGFSVDFLEFLLNRVLTESIRDANAGILYQGIVRDLIGRQEMVQNLAVDGVLVDARKQCAEYLARRWVQVKAQKGFSRVEKEVMRQLSEDIGVPYRALTKPIESDFTAMFSFKSKPGKIKSKPLDDGTNRSSNRSRRLSLSGLRRQHSNTTLKSSHDDLRQLTRTRSLSNDMVPSRPIISDTLSAESINKLSEKGLSSQPLIRLLSLESEARRQRQEGGDGSSPTHSHHSRSQSLPTCLADALLPLDLPMHQGTKSSSSSSDNSASTNTSNDTPGSPTSPRPSRLKFELPTTPLRAKAPMQKPFLVPSAAPNEHSHGKHRRHGSRRARSPHKSRWGFGGGSSDISDDDELITMVTPVIGAKVELLRRPLPTLGMIKFVGNVNFAKGIWVGVELESRLGTNDGQVEGVRYFRTDPQRGVFVKIDDFKVVSLPNNDGAPLTI
ncbi:hypothetical protein K492DRAFT_148817 [Lichtheimia hyalospora FSU 10163]|nr:hypothetical protein K492DRAFT_148817 [Lichtheimia hyalospora FSU 10163]